MTFIYWICTTITELYDFDRQTFDWSTDPAGTTEWGLGQVGAVLAWAPLSWNFAEGCISELFRSVFMNGRILIIVGIGASAWRMHRGQRKSVSPSSSGTNSEGTAQEMGLL